MIAMLLMWLLLFLTSCFSGVVLLSAFAADESVPSASHTWKAVWCGLMVQGLGALGLSLLGPVTAMAAGATWGIMALLAVLSARVRRALRQTSQYILSGLRWWPAVLVIAAAVSLYCSQAPCNYDTLLYQHQAIKWFAQHGAVQGLVLLHHRLGFVSSWFAMAAPLEDVMPTRSATVLNGFVLLLAIFQLYFCMIRLYAGKVRLADVFSILGLSAVLGLHLLFLEPVSAAPDFAVSVMTVVLAGWLVEASGHPERLAFEPALLLAVMLPAVKLSALPVALVVGLAYAILVPRIESQKKRVVALGCLYLLATAPLALVSWRLTGSLLFPSAFLAADVPWGLGKEATRAVAAGVQSWARWNGPAPDGANIWGWLLPWLSSSKGALFCLTAAGNLAAVGWMVLKASRRDIKTGAQWCVPALGMIGTTYLLVTAPNPRFGFGMLVLGWCWIANQLFVGMGERAVRVFPQHRWTFLPQVGLVLLVVLGMAGLVLRPLDSWRRSLNAASAPPLLAASDGRVNWLRPAAVPSIGYERQTGGGAVSAFPIDLRSDRLNNFIYSYPANTDICGPAPLPAANHRLNGIKLASPDRGLRGGFVRMPRAEIDSHEK